MQKPLRHDELADGASGVGEPPPLRRARRFRPHPGWTALGLLALAIALLLVFFQWNWLRPPLAHWASARLHRPVAIAGDLHVHPWSWTPEASVEGVTIGEPAWARNEAPMAKIPRLVVRVRLKSLLFGPVVAPLVEVDRPSITLFADASGRQNWKFGVAPKGSKTRPPVIQHLVIRDGRVAFADAKRRIHFVGALEADETGGEPGGRPGFGGTRIQGHLVVGGQPWAGPAPVVDAPSLLIETRLMALMRHRTVLPLVEADGARIRLLRDAAGRESWSSGKSAPLRLPAISRLVLKDGAIRYDDEGRKLHFTGSLSSTQTIAATGRGSFRLTGSGRLNAAPFRALITGGALVNVRKTTPYPFRASIVAGATRIGIAATIAHPFDFGQLSGALQVSGPDLSNLRALTGLVLPATPPYSLAAGFARDRAVWALQRIRGRVGESDLSGALRIDHTRKRAMVTGDLASRYLELADLTATIGAAPRHPGGRPMSPSQKAAAARARAEHRLLPDTRLGLDKLGAMDARVSYRASRVRAGHTALRGLAFRLVLDHGVLAIDPLDVTLPQGRMRGLIRIDGRNVRRPATLIDLSLAGARLETLIGRNTRDPPLEGGLWGRARLAGTGFSVAQIAASANGGVAAVVPGGEIRAAFAELLGIDAAKGLYLLLSKNESETPIRCAVADFQAVSGVLNARTLVLDTDPVLDTGKGSIDLRNETLSLTLSGRPKKFRILHVAAPITLTGTLEAPKVGVQVGHAIPQLALSAILGVVASPLAAILPFVNLPGRHGADCSRLIAEARAGR